ncbi:MAG: porin family protein [Cellvibrionaceae bacterium]
MKNKNAQLFASLLLAVSSNALYAQVYVSGTVGPTAIDDSIFKDTTGLRLSGGYHLMDNLAIDLSYVNLGEFELNSRGLAQVNAVLAGSGITVTDASSEVDGYELALVGNFPLSNAFSLFGRIGNFFWDADLDISHTNNGLGGMFIPRDTDGADLSLGLGVEVKLGETVSLTAEYTQYTIEDGDIHLLGAGVKARF